LYFENQSLLLHSKTELLDTWAIKHYPWMIVINMLVFVNYVRQWIRDIKN